MRFHLALAFILAAPSQAIAQDERIVYSGTPLVAGTADGLAATTRPLRSESAGESGLRIVLRGGRFYWASRGDRELRRSESGRYIIFACAAGIIKLVDPMWDATRSPLRATVEHEQFDYVEMLHEHLTTLTYWGRGSGDARALRGG